MSLYFSRMCECVYFFFVVFLFFVCAVCSSYFCIWTEFVDLTWVCVSHNMKSGFLLSCFFLLDADL